MKFEHSALLLALAPALTSSFNLPFTKPSPRHVASFLPKSTSPPPPALRPLFGILDEVNDDSLFSLGGGKPDTTSSGAPVVSDKSQAFEIFLAELVFSTQDIRVDIMDNIEKAEDPEFRQWLKEKSETSTDVDEREAMRSLSDTIEETVNMIALGKQQEEREKKAKEETIAAEAEVIDAQAEAGRSMSDSDVIRKASKVDTAGIDAAVASDTTKKTFMESEITPEIRQSYQPLMKKLLPPYKPGETVEMVVRKNYEMVDAQLIKCLVEKKGNEEGSEEVLSAISAIQEMKVAAATESLKKVLGAGDPARMEGEIIKLARDGGVDESFLLLLEANINQATAAGATDVAAVMNKLKLKAETEKDKQQTAPEIQLLRKLMRTEDTKDRERLLEDAFTPKEKLLVKGTTENAEKALTGEAPEEEKAMPDVPPPDFINACKAVMLNFGNVSSDNQDVMKKIQTIAAEAEIVATRIYGKGMSPQEQQDRAWKEESTSIFDLERMELDAMSRGEQAPWSKDSSEDEDMLGGMFDKDGKMRIGGS
ncbi:hypothetical protein TrVE_jg2419 [Triparma verrucosa]|uniref:Uncharacterized protein n=2 Tax=Triparma TaxID=722752 RepID=A0A9W7E999_9STRA|nr:hypothetical protein TrST_g12414 [Triparma strigata]GMI06143.1 hypothetical protein TrVE_jg2419 [Triparma verrucosa]